MPLPSDVAPSWRPAIAASARATNTRVTFLRYGCVKSVLSRGFAGPAARSATRAIRSRVSRWPTSAAAGLLGRPRQRGDCAQHDAGIADDLTLHPEGHRHAEHGKVE